MKVKTKTERTNEFLNIMCDEGKVEISTEFMDWLTENKFFTQAASTKYHGNYEGGLFDHSLNTTTTLVNMTRQLGIKWARPESPYIIGMFHDLCKTDNYNVVVEDEGVEYFGCQELKGRVVSFEHNDNCILKGHAEKSIMLLSQFMTLTEEEIFCIRFHMGAYNTSDWNEFDKAIRKYETVLWTHTADMYASKIIENIE